MTIKEFLQDNTLNAVETVDGLIISLVCGETEYGIDVDTSNIESGTPTTRREDYILTDNTLSVDDIFVNINTTNML
jgi:hypothetical protein